MRLIVLIFLLFQSTFAGELHVACASNFSKTAKKIKIEFENKTGHEILFSFASTGKHYTQIIHGAPFDIFLAADTLRPFLLEQNGFIKPGQRFTYAIGQLVVWTAKKGDDKTDIWSQIAEPDQKIVIANPKLAPYGRAARQVLEAMELWQQKANTIIFGENISQAFQFAVSGNELIGLLAHSQVLENSGHYELVSQKLYEPLKQQAILIKDTEPALKFFTFLKSRRTMDIILKSGYLLPDSTL